MKKEEFDDIIEEFVSENFCAEGCRSCSEQGTPIVPDDFNGSYEKATKELFERIINNRIKVESSNIDYVSYSEQKEELSVWFKSRKAEEHYIYSHVSVITFNDLIKAESKGKYFMANIKGNEFKRIE